MKTLIGISIFVLSVSAMAQNKPPAPSSKNNSCLVQCPQGPKGPKGDKGDPAPTSIYFKISSYVDRGAGTRRDGQQVVAPHFICLRSENLCNWIDYNPDRDIPSCDNPLDADLGIYYYDADSRPLKRLNLAKTREEADRVRQQSQDELIRVPVVTIRACANIHEVLAPVLE